MRELTDRQLERERRQQVFPLQKEELQPLTFPQTAAPATATLRNLLRIRILPSFLTGSNRVRVPQDPKDP